MIYQSTTSSSQQPQHPARRAAGRFGEDDNSVSIQRPPKSFVDPTPMYQQPIDEDASVDARDLAVAPLPPDALEYQNSGMFSIEMSGEEFPELVHDDDVPQSPPPKDCDDAEHREGMYRDRSHFTLLLRKDSSVSCLTRCTMTSYAMSEVVLDHEDYPYDDDHQLSPEEEVAFKLKIDELVDAGDWDAVLRMSKINENNSDAEYEEYVIDDDVDEEEYEEVSVSENDDFANGDVAVGIPAPAPVEQEYKEDEVTPPTSQSSCDEAPKKKKKKKKDPDAPKKKKDGKSKDGKSKDGKSKDGKTKRKKKTTTATTGAVPNSSSEFMEDKPKKKKRKEAGKKKKKRTKKSGDGATSSDKKRKEEGEETPQQRESASTTEIDLRDFSFGWEEDFTPNDAIYADPAAMMAEEAESHGSSQGNHTAQTAKVRHSSASPNSTNRKRTKAGILKAVMKVLESRLDNMVVVRSSTTKARTYN